MKERGLLAKEARRIAAKYGVSLRQAYRYAATGRTPAECVRVGVDGRRYHVRLGERWLDQVDVRRIRYVVAGVAKRAGQHGITESDVAELVVATQRINELASVWKAWIAGGAGHS
jgi:hypothetical protein